MLDIEGAWGRDGGGIWEANAGAELGMELSGQRLEVGVRRFG